MRSNLLLRASSGRAEPRFSRPRRSFFQDFCIRRTINAQNVRHRKNTVKTNTKHTSELPRIDRKSTKIRSAGASECVWRCERRCERLGSCPGGSWNVYGVPGRRVWTAPGRSWLAQGGPRSALGRHWDVQKLSRARLDASPKRTWALQTAQTRLTIDSGSILVGFSLIFVKIFHRFSSEPRASKTRTQNLKKKSRDPQRTSWLLRCAVGSCCSHIFRNDFRTLRVQPFSLRTHKLT